MQKNAKKNVLTRVESKKKYVYVGFKDEKLFW